MWWICFCANTGEACHTCERTFRISYIYIQSTMFICCLTLVIIFFSPNIYHLQWLYRIPNRFFFRNIIPKTIETKSPTHGTPWVNTTLWFHIDHPATRHRRRPWITALMRRMADVIGDGFHGFTMFHHVSPIWLNLLETWWNMEKHGDSPCFTIWFTFQ